MCWPSKMRGFWFVVMLSASQVWPKCSCTATTSVAMRLAIYRAPQKGPQNWCRAKIVEKCRNMFLTILDVFLPCVQKCRKVSKMFLLIFDVFLTWPLPAGPFCGSLIFTGVLRNFWSSHRSPKVGKELNTTHTHTHTHTHFCRRPQEPQDSSSI